MWRDLTDKWRRRSDELEPYAPQVARAFRACADELEVATTEWELEALKLEAASDEGGYAYGSLQRMLADGLIENVGEPGAPRIRRIDVPKKPGHKKPNHSTSASPVDDVLANRATRG